MEEQGLCNLFTSDANHDTMERNRRAFTSRNLDELERDLMQVERMLVPLLNKVRAMRGAAIVIVPKE